VAEHISGFTLKYYDATGTEIPTPLTSQANRDLIRKISLVLSSQTENINPATGKYDTTSIQASVQTRCMGVNQSSDLTPCALPTINKVSDLGICGKLKLEWTESSSPDSAGYRVYYKKTGMSAYSAVFDVPGGSSSSVTMTGLQDGVQYDIAMRCYDSAGNINTLYAGPVTGTSGDFDTQPNDITPPALPLYTTQPATAGDGFVTLTWAASTSVDTGGYNIYRSDDDISYTKVGEVDSTVLTYTNTLLPNCPDNPYYYKVTSWDCAANEISNILQSAVYGDADYVGGVTDVPVNGTTSTFPKDVIPPSDPTDFMVVAGADKIYLSYTTPPPPDSFEGTRILRRTDQYPVDEEDSTAIGPNLQKDYSPETSNQTYTLIDSEEIVIDTTYFYRSFTFDRCKNYSAGVLSQAMAKPCGDGEVGSEHYGSPSAPASLTSNTCETASLSWPASTGSETGNLFDPASENDVIGYNVYRSETAGGAYTDKRNTTPVTSTSYADSGVVMGNTYFYVVKALDCADNESAISSPETTVAPNNIDHDTSVTVVTSGTSGMQGSQRNVVTLAIEAKGTTSMTLDTAAITWNVVPAFLKKVTLKPQGGGSYVLWDDSTLPLSGSGSTIDFASFQSNPAFREISAGSTGNILELDFRNFADNAFVSMNGATINFTISYTSEIDDAACESSTFTVPVKSGPVILQTIQDKPVEPTTSNLSPGNVVVMAGTQDPDTYVWILDEVPVSTEVSAEAGTTISSVDLYYQTTATTVGTAPTTDYSAYPSGWTKVTMCQQGSLSTYKTLSDGLCSTYPIPTLLGERVWYYILTIDSNTNVDIEPEPSVGIYSYDQQSKFDVVLTVNRSIGGGGDISVGALLTDENGDPVTGANIVAYILNRDTSAEEKGLMQDLGSGLYAYPGTGTVSGYSNDDIDVALYVTKTGFTETRCGEEDIDKNDSLTTKNCF
jgi:fibronectin type 3 domain-containing protein